MSCFELKKATEQDLMLIFSWANDDECRQNSFSQEKIELPKHKVWFENMLNSDNVFLYILYQDNNPIGQIRISTEKANAIISYSLDKKYRGQGYGEIILRILEEEVIKEKFQITFLVAKVKYSNIASQKIFEKLGYSSLKQKECLEYTKKIL